MPLTFRPSSPPPMRRTTSRTMSGEMRFPDVGVPGEIQRRHKRSPSDSTIETEGSLTTEGSSSPSTPGRSDPGVRGAKGEVPGRLLSEVSRASSLAGCDDLSQSSSLCTRTKSSEAPHSVVLTRRFLALALLLAGALAFSAGAVSRIVLLGHMNRAGLNGTVEAPTYDTENEEDDRLPTPTVDGKVVPYTTYGSRNFPAEGAVTSHTVHLDRSGAAAVGATDITEEGASHDDELHLPAGQHLLVDIQGVDPAFLDSESRLAQAMVELTTETGLTLLSYHCHSLVPEGISCAGVLLESHVAFHTWPKHGAIAMDLFTCGSGLLIPILPLIRNLFAVPALPDMEPTVVWSHKVRGFKEGFSPDWRPDSDPLESNIDLGDDIADHTPGAKKELVSARTRFQRVDVYELEEPRYGGVDKVLYLDGVMQSSLYGDASYHESLVHPAMTTHPNPKRVAIIGGGEGATLREVLKHNTVEEVVMVEIDGELTEICREHLPEWTDCTDNAGSDADNCFDDSRARVVFEDAFAWFEDRFGDDDSDDSKDDKDVAEDRFDIIIMDALDPERTVEIVGNLYKDTFVEAMFNGLTDEGMLVVQMGQSAALTDAAYEMGEDIDKAKMMKALENVGFESMHTYDEGHSFFQAPWAYLLSFKSETSRASWYRSAAETDVELQRRMHRSRSGRPLLHFFDSATMMSYQFPSKSIETKSCRSEDAPWECDEYAWGIDPEWVNAPAELYLEAGKSRVGEHAGRGLFAARDIPEGTTDIGLMTKAFHVLPSTFSVIDYMDTWGEQNGENGASVKDEIKLALTFTRGYGYAAYFLGRVHYAVNAGITTFCNHGCNGTYSYGSDSMEFTEMDVSLDKIPEWILNKQHAVYSPVLERHLRQRLITGDYALRDIKQGEEILCNYLSMNEGGEGWARDVESLQRQCTGVAMGDIQGYESEAENK